MKTVVITGSAKGLGFEIAKCFRNKNYNVIISDNYKKDLEIAKKELIKVKGIGDIDYYVCNTTKENDLAKLINKTKKKYGTIDFWINNAKIEEPKKMICDFTSEEINQILDTNLYAPIIATNLIAKTMVEQNSGSIYNILDYENNNLEMPSESIYKTATSGLAYFTKSLAKELERMKADVILGRISPGIVITDSLTNSNKKIELDSKTKKIFNIFGDYPDVVAKYLVNKIIINTNNNTHINWLTKRRIIWKRITSIFKKRDFFKD